MSEFSRPLIQFIVDMGERLDANACKSTWRKLSYGDLLRRVVDELLELDQAVKKGESAAIIYEAADVANFCMMIADLAREKGTHDE